MYYKEYTPGTIFEFDYFEELRQFDTQYLSHTHSGIIRNIKLVFRCDEEDIVDFRNVSEGMTNTSFIFKIDGVDYIYRHPGDGTDSIINRRNEKTSLIKAKRWASTRHTSTPTSTRGGRSPGSSPNSGSRTTEALRIPKRCCLSCGSSMLRT